MPILPENFKSLTTMAIEQEAKAINAKQVAIETAKAEAEMRQKQQYLAEMAQAYSNSQPPSQQQEVAIEGMARDTSFVSDMQARISQLKRSYEIASKNGMTEDANKAYDNLQSTEKALFDWSENRKKEQTTKLSEAASILNSATDETSFQSALQEIATNVDPSLARTLYARFGGYNKQSLPKIKAFIARGLSLKDQADIADKDRRFEFQKLQEKNKLAQQAIENRYRKKADDRAERLAKESALTARLARIEKMQKMGKPKEEEISPAAFRVLSDAEVEEAKAVGESLGLDWDNEEDKVLLKDIAGEAKIKAAKEKKSFIQAFKELYKQRTTVEETPTSVPEGVPEDVWNVMTEEEKALWQK